MNWLGLYFSSLLAALLAILPIVNPFGAVPLVMSASGHLPEQERLRQIRRACVYTFFLMSGFLVAGGLIMNFFGISLPGMRIAGGLIVAFLGFQMLFPNPISDKEAMTKAAGESYDIAFTPLAMPGLSGPGTFAVVMSLSSQAAARQGYLSIVDFMGVLTAIFLTQLKALAESTTPAKAAPISAPATEADANAQPAAVASPTGQETPVPPMPQ